MKIDALYKRCKLKGVQLIYTSIMDSTWSPTVHGMQNHKPSSISSQTPT